MSRADLVKALEQCVAALDAAPARFRINFEPYWQWQREQQEPALLQAQVVLAEETVSKKA